MKKYYATLPYLLYVGLIAFYGIVQDPIGYTAMSVLLVQWIYREILEGRYEDEDFLIKTIVKLNQQAKLERIDKKYDGLISPLGYKTLREMEKELKANHLSY